MPTKKDRVGEPERRKIVRMSADRQYSDINPLELLLQSILNTNQTLGDKIDRVIESMATKEDVEKLDVRLHTIEDSKLPKWFGPLVTGVFASATPILALIAYLTHHLK